MNRRDAAADTLAIIRACLGAGCEYDMFLSRAIPPAECNSIALTWTDSAPEYDSECTDMGGACYRQEHHTMRIVITRCCAKADSGLSFDSVAEEDAATCLWRDVDLLEQCLACSDFSQFVIDHGILSFRRSATRFDVETLGGCSSAYIDVAVVSEECCP